MKRVPRRAVVVVSAIAVAVGGMLVTAGTANADPLDPPVIWSKCTTNMQWVGDAGVINAQLAPSGSLQWNVSDHTDNAGLWIADVLVGKRRVDGKKQDYAPHGSVAAVDMRSGYVLRFQIEHIDTQGRRSLSDPAAGCIIP